MYYICSGMIPIGILFCTLFTGGFLSSHNNEYLIREA